MSQCLRCGRELIDPNAKYGWRCAEKVGIPYGNSGSIVKKYPELEKHYNFLSESSKKKFDEYFDEIEEKNSYIDTAIEGAGMYMSVADELEKAYNEETSKKNDQNQRIDNLMKTKIEFENNKKLEELQTLVKIIQQAEKENMILDNELDTQKQVEERKVFTRKDIVLDENDKKLSIPNQEKLINEKLKWHNAMTEEEREKATQEGKQIRESDKITPNNFSEYSPEKQKQYLIDLSQKSNIKLSEQEMLYLSDFLSNHQEIKINEKGDMVKVFQKVLSQIGFSDIKEATGNYSEKTRSAIASIVELVTGEKSDGTKIGNNEKAKLVQILSEIANGDTTIANKLKDKYNKNFNQARFDEVTGKNKAEEKKEGNNQQADIELNNNYIDNSRFPNTSIDNYNKNYPISLSQADIDKGVTFVTINNKKYKDISVPFNKALNNIVITAQGIREQNAGNGLVGKGVAGIWFVSQVDHKMPWDIKRREQWEKTIASIYPGSSSTEVVLYGTITTPEKLGNISYGYIGAALGLSLDELYAGSWVAADFPRKAKDVQNEMNDRISIKAGYDWYKKE
jgi:hypothetical protein